MKTVCAHQYYDTDLCIIGGGMSGLCAAIAAARHGAKVVLMHDRPVLGGNASSEIRMWIRGAAGKENRETGILQEIELENIYRNPTMNYSVWDTVLYQMVLREENITLLLNCSCLGCDTNDDKITASPVGSSTVIASTRSGQKSLWIAQVTVFWRNSAVPRTGSDGKAATNSENMRLPRWQTAAPWAPVA